MSFSLHVLAGCRGLLLPAPLPGEALAALLGPGLVAATAFWLSPQCGRFTHDFLLDEPGDARVAVFAAALRDGFGSRAAPLVILPELWDAAAPAAGPGRDPLAVLHEFGRRLPGAPLVLHALALPERPAEAGEDWAGDAGLLPEAAARGLADLRARLAAAGHAGAVETRLLTLSPAMPPFAALMRNALARVIAARASDHLGPAGLAVNRARLEAAAAGLLARWEAVGIAPDPAVGAAGLDRLAARALAALLDQG